MRTAPLHRTTLRTIVTAANDLDDRPISDLVVTLGRRGTESRLHALACPGTSPKQPGG